MAWVVLMQTADDTYRPGKFTLVTQQQQQGYNTDPEPIDDEVIRLFKKEHVEQLIDTQQSQERFNQCQFWIDGTSALAALWKRYMHNGLAALPAPVEGSCCMISCQQVEEYLGWNARMDSFPMMLRQIRSTLDLS